MCGSAVLKRYINVCNSDVFTMTICSSVLCILMVEGMSVVVNIDILVKLCTMGIFALGVSLDS